MHDLGREMLAGAGAGAITKTIVAPLERAKIVKQVQAGRNPDKYKSIFDIWRHIWRAEGLRGLYVGNGTNVIRVVPVYGLKFGLNDHYKRAFGGYFSGLTHLVAAGIATGLTQHFVTLPLEVIRTRITISAALDPPVTYKGIVDCCGRMIRNEGIFSLYKGLAATIAGGVPHVALQMTLFATMSGYVPKDATGKPDILWLLPAGTVTGLVAQTLTYPGDTVRKLMMMDGVNGTKQQYGSTVACVKQVFRTRGVKGFYGGLAANAVRCVPESTIQYACYEYFKRSFVT